MQLSPAALEKLNIKSRDKVILSFGLNSIETEVKEGDYSGNRFLIPMETYLQLKTSRINQPLLFYYDEEKGELKLGPVIGVLLGAPVMLQIQETLDLYQTIAIKAYQEGFVLYFFTPDQIDYDEGTVWGFKYRLQSGDWILERFPLPDVIWNQVGSLSENLKECYRKFFKIYVNESEQIKLVTDFGLMNKLFNHYNLKNEGNVKKYLPETKNCNNVETVMRMLKKYKAVILKPTSASLGVGVCRVETVEKNKYKLIYHDRVEGKQIHNFASEKELKLKLKNIILQRPYLAQQPINLLKFRGRPVDFRVHLFKNGQGKWEIIVTKAKLGPPEGIVTNSIWGGTRMKAEEILKDTYGSEGQKLQKDIEEAALKIAKVLDEIHPNKYGELGFDIALDNKKRVWMIEVNPKPNWVVPHGADKSLLEKRLAKNLLEYSCYLLDLNEKKKVLSLPVNFYQNNGK